MNITKGRQGGAVKTVIYGPEGIGKSTFASKFPNAIFCDTEDSTRHLDVSRMPQPVGWDDILNDVRYFIDHPDEIGTFVLDTADWAEKMAATYVCHSDGRNMKSVEEFGYGKGYVYVREQFAILLDLLSKLNRKGVNIVITAHAILKKFEQPDEMGAYDRWSLKLNERNVAPLVKEWADMVLFVNYKTDVVTVKEGSQKSTKAKGGKRVMYTTHHPCWDAKNRFGLDDVLPFEYDAIKHVVPEDKPVTPEPSAFQAERQTVMVENGGVITPKEVDVFKIDKKDTPKLPRPSAMTSEDKDKDKLLETIWTNMMTGGVTLESVQAVIAEKGYYALSVEPRNYSIEFLSDVMIAAWSQVLTHALAKQANLPFL